MDTKKPARSRALQKKKASRPARGLRVAVYHRVSTTDQDKTLAEAQLLEHAERIGGTVVLNVKEQASGAFNGRPGLHRVLDAAKSGNVDVVMVWKLDRFGRSALDLLANIRALEDAGVRFVVKTQNIDIKPGGDAMSRLLLTMLSAVSEFERDLIRERTRLGLAKARREGKQLGRPMKEGGPTPEKVRELRAQRKSWGQIAKMFRCTVGMARRRAAG
jgi:putative DNA-invertase from lambdoid prophage Rac